MKEEEETEEKGEKEEEREVRFASRVQNLKVPSAIPFSALPDAVCVTDRSAVATILSRAALHVSEVIGNNKFRDETGIRTESWTIRNDRPTPPGNSLKPTWKTPRKEASIMRRRRERKIRRQRGERKREREEEKDGEKKLHRLNTRSISPRTFSKLRYGEGC